MNSTVGPIFNENFVEKEVCVSREQCMGPTGKAKKRKEKKRKRRQTQTRERGTQSKRSLSRETLLNLSLF